MVAEKRLQPESWLEEAGRYRTSAFRQSINQSDEDALTLSPKPHTHTHTKTHTQR
jgi:hypothetical protein